MKNLKNTLATGMMIATILFSTTFANAGTGIIIAGATSDDGDPCTMTTAQKQSTFSKMGIVIAGFTGIVIAGFTGIVIAGATDEAPQTNCGIIIAG